MLSSLHCDKPLRHRLPTFQPSSILCQPVSFASFDAARSSANNAKGHGKAQSPRHSCKLISMHASHIFRYANEYLDKKISVYNITLGSKLVEIKYIKYVRLHLKYKSSF